MLVVVMNKQHFYTRELVKGRVIADIFGMIRGIKRHWPYNNIFETFSQSSFNISLITKTPVALNVKDS